MRERDQAIDERGVVDAASPPTTSRYMLIVVKPGSVLISFTNNSPVERLSRKSTRARPAPSIASNAATRLAPDLARRASASSARRNLQCAIRRRCTSLRSRRTPATARSRPASTPPARRCRAPRTRSRARPARRLRRRPCDRIRAARSIAGAELGRPCTFEMPTLDPRFAGLTKSG